MAFRPAQDVELSRRVQVFLKEGYEKFGYRGFSMSVDDSFQDRSYYRVALKDDGSIAATIRATHPAPGAPVPIELARRSNGARYRIARPGPIMELNSFIYRDPRTLPVLFRGLFEHVVTHDIRKTLLLVDDRSERYRKLYTGAGFECSREHTDTVSFETFTRSDGTPVEWRIMEMDRPRIETFWADRLATPRLGVNLPGRLSWGDRSFPCSVLSVSRGGALVSIATPGPDSREDEPGTLHFPLEGRTKAERAVHILKRSKSPDRHLVQLHLAFTMALPPGEWAGLRRRAVAPHEEPEPSLAKTPRPV